MVDQVKMRRTSNKSYGRFTLFNAGVGAVLTNDERVSLDASFMDGEN